MTWPFVTRKVHELELARLREQIDVAQDRAREHAVERDYWRSRCERLTDAALSRAGAIHEPTMVERKPEAPNIMATVASALAMKEFDSSKPPGSERVAG